MTFWEIKANLSAKVSPRDGQKKKIINQGGCRYASCMHLHGQPAGTAPWLLQQRAGPALADAVPARPSLPAPDALGERQKAAPLPQALAWLRVKPEPPPSPCPGSRELGSQQNRASRGAGARGSWQGGREAAQRGPNPHPGSPAPPKGGVLIFIYSAAHCIHSTLSISIT